METKTTAHPLRTITLQFDRSKVAPKFETDLLQCYHDVHDRTWERLQRTQRGRQPIPGYRYRIEGIERLFNLATYRFNRLKKMIPANPVRETVYTQLKGLLHELDEALNELIPPLIEETNRFMDDEDYFIEQDEWLEENAFPKFHEIFPAHEAYSMDIVFFDLDLEGFRHELDFVKKQEALYLKEMGSLVDDFTDLTDQVEHLLSDASEFDLTLLD